MNMNKVTEELIEWIGKSPTAFQAVNNAAELLKSFGAEILHEQEHWTLKPQTTYVVTRNASSLIAFYVPEAPDHFQLVASHSDSPAFRVKEQAAMTVENRYVKLNTEGYGSMIDSSWFDRPLSLAGRVLVDRRERVESVLYDAGRNLCLIPNLAIHMNREINSGYKYNHQTDLLPLIGMEQGGGCELTSVLSAGMDFSPEQILAADLSLYNREAGCIWGADGEFISAPRLDDQECVFASLKGFAEAIKDGTAKAVVPVVCIFDNEEVGSRTKQGADSEFLSDTLTRIGDALGYGAAALSEMLAKSFLISADNAHAVHPNHPEKCDPTNRPVLNGGVVIKYNSSQRYTTDAFSAAVMKKICEQENIPYQTFFNRSDIPGGATLGNLSAAHVSIHSADIGLAQLAMHSAYETAGAQDVESLVRVMKAYYEHTIVISDEGFLVK